MAGSLFKAEQPNYSALTNIGLERLYQIEGNPETQATPIADLYVIKRPVYADLRGSFSELYGYHTNVALRKQGVDFTRVQTNLSESASMVWRGLHFEPEGKFITLISGSALCVWTDLRIGSETYGTLFALSLSGTPVDGMQTSVYIPPGVANGFLALEPVTYHYLVSEFYPSLPNGSGVALRYNDPHVVSGLNEYLAVATMAWPLDGIIVSERDAGGVSFSEAVELYRQFSG